MSASAASSPAASPAATANNNNHMGDNNETPVNTPTNNNNGPAPMEGIEPTGALASKYVDALALSRQSLKKKEKELESLIIKQIQLETMEPVPEDELATIVKRMEALHKEIERTRKNIAILTPKDADTTTSSRKHITMNLVPRFCDQRSQRVS
ncbi:hypothetical protein O0I10_012292 [Lichtheimia ornata]|uniref:Uncharacterized protein n=1 Tax=Lichtheimia ornata TaxID=688661 RepID=A0AAD7XVX3_9FUNG|nr:uncharacterized protein O0I10_012292 [Lichtheimia ornata]KAJ8652102.1 hypothetical protein O0I10_012292 [Lichtheimia ornata]